MPVLSTPQQSDWASNVYVLTTTRVFVVIGLAYLIKSLYNLVPSIWGTRSASVAAAVADGIDLANIVPGVVPGAVDIGPDLEANITLDVRRPQPTYDPHNHTERSWANPPTRHQGAEVSGQSAAVQTVTEQDVSPYNDDSHIEEDMNITIGYARQETMAGSAVNEEIGESPTPTPPPGDTILPYPDA